MQHGTCRGEKISAIRGSIGLVGRLKHNLREKDNLVNVDHSRTPDNEFLIGSSNIAGIVADTEARLKTVSTKIRADSVKAIEFVITLTPDALEKNGGKMTPEKVDLYLSDGLEFAKKLYGAENVVSAIRHRDEGVDHLHVIAVPIQKIEKTVRRVTSVDPETGKKTFELTGEKKSKTVLNCQNIFEDRLSLSQFQTKFYKEVSKKYGLERGVKSLDRTQERSNLDKALTLRAENLEKKEQKFDKDYAKYLDEKSDFDRKNGLIEKQLKTLEDRLEKVEKREKKTAEREKEVEQREAKNDKKDEFLTVREAQHEKFSEAEKTKLRGFELPETGFLESAKDYKARIEPVVKGKISRALQTIDQQDQRVMIAVDETKEKLRTAEIAVYSLRQEVQTTRSALEEYKGVYKNLKDHVMGITSMDEVKGIQTKLAPKKSIDRGMER